MPSSTSSWDVQICLPLFSRNRGVYEQRVVRGLRKKFKLLVMLQEHFGSKPEHFYDVFVPMEAKAWELREPELQ